MVMVSQTNEKWLSVAKKEWKVVINNQTKKEIKWLLIARKNEKWLSIVRNNEKWLIAKKSYS